MWEWFLPLFVFAILSVAIRAEFTGWNDFGSATISVIGLAFNSIYIGLIWTPEDAEILGVGRVAYIFMFCIIEFGFLWLTFVALMDIRDCKDKLKAINTQITADLEVLVAELDKHAKRT